MARANYSRSRANIPTNRLKKAKDPRAWTTCTDKKQAWRKCFCWYHNEGGEWQKGKGAETPPLYKTANIGWARDRHRTLYIAEGEKDVDTLTQKLRLPAVCSPHRAGRGRLESKWDERYNDLFTGCDVAILADNDEPGREFARYVAGQIAPYAASVRLPDMSFEWDWLPEKGDITDVLERDTPIRGKTVAETVKFRLEALTDNRMAVVPVHTDGQDNPDDSRPRHGQDVFGALPCGDDQQGLPVLRRGKRVARGSERGLSDG